MNLDWWKSFYTVDNFNLITISKTTFCCCLLKTIKQDTVAFVMWSRQRFTSRKRFASGTRTNKYVPSHVFCTCRISNYWGIWNSWKTSFRTQTQESCVRIRRWCHLDGALSAVQGTVRYRLASGPELG